MNAIPAERPVLLRRALRLEYLTVGWNVVEGVIAIAAAMASGSVALLGFGIDSFVESASGSVMIWRLHAERRTDDAERIEQVERRAQKLVAGSLIVLAVYIAWDSITSLLANERPEPSLGRWPSSMTRSRRLANLSSLGASRRARSWTTYARCRRSGGTPAPMDARRSPLRSSRGRTSWGSSGWSTS